MAATSRAVTNWPEIRREYVDGVQRDDGIYYPTFEDLAKRWNIPASTIGNHGTRERWPEAREAAKIAAQETHRLSKVEELAKKAVIFDDKAFTIADALLTFTQNRLATHAQAQTAPGIRELKELAEVAVKAQHVGRLALGESTDNLRHLDRLPAFSFVIAGGRVIEGESSREG